MAREMGLTQKVLHLILEAKQLGSTAAEQLFDNGPALKDKPEGEESQADTEAVIELEILAANVSVVCAVSVLRCIQRLHADGSVLVVRNGWDTPQRQNNGAQEPEAKTDKIYDFHAPASQSLTPELSRAAKRRRLEWIVMRHLTKLSSSVGTVLITTPHASQTTPTTAN